MAAGFVVESVKNGLMDSDDYVRKGLPPARFALSGGEAALNAVFERHSHAEPFDMVKNELRSMSETIRDVVGSDHPVLSSVASHFFAFPGKRIRPAIVLLAAMAANGGAVSPAQRRLSEITELIHTASLLHDDVIDDASTRRNAPSVNAKFGNKLAILGGDFLLARASNALARLRNVDVVELLSVVIEHLVKGEVMQIGSAGLGAGARAGLGSSGRHSPAVQFYMTKSYYKTASLMANSAKACAVLEGHDEHTQLVMYEYGKHLGLAFQLVDDLLDFDGDEAELGKPANNDLRTGLATLPVLYAAERYPVLHDMIARRFAQEGDVETALSLVRESDAIASARGLAVECAAHAVASADELPESEARSAMITLVDRVLNRST